MADKSAILEKVELPEGKYVEVEVYYKKDGHRGRGYYLAVTPYKLDGLFRRWASSNPGTLSLLALANRYSPSGFAAAVEAAKGQYAPALEAVKAKTVAFNGY